MIQRHAFTLVELLTAVVIILILMGAAWGVGSFVSSYARKSRCKAQLKSIEIALDSYNSDWHYYPQNGGGSAVELDEDHASFWDSLQSPSQKAYIDFQQGKFARKEVGGDVFWVDAFDQPFRYQLPSGSGTPEIWSVGPDGQNGTADDISNKDIP